LITTINKYINAIILEYEHDSGYHEYLGLSGVLKQIPRCFSYIKYIEKFRAVLKYMIYPISFLWILALNTIYVICILIKTLLMSIRFPQISLEEKSLYMNSSENKYYSYIEEAASPQCILNFPFKKYKLVNSSSKMQIDLYSITNSRILIKSAIAAVLVPMAIVKNRKANLMLYTYTAFKWAWVYNAIAAQNIENLWFSNHYDRWTILATNLENCKCTLVQHGKLFHEDVKSEIEIVPKISNKLNNIQRVYYLDDRSISIFSTLILGIPEYIKINSQLEIIPWRVQPTAKVKILVVGNPAQYNLQRKMISTLFLECGDTIDVCYKLHPRQNKIKEFSNIWIYSDLLGLPESDIAISYGSSIDDEIALVSACKVLQYDQSLDNLHSEIISEIKVLIYKND
jgi:hypothetical protein